ncbi:hypothetical protein [Azospirillum sp. sgz301742]
MGAIRIEWTDGQGNCDECGPYEVITVSITKPDGTVVELRYSGHGDDGERLSDPATAVAAVLRALGHEVELSIT